jgi:hypothetical protein
MDPTQYRLDSGTLGTWFEVQAERRVDRKAKSKEVKHLVPKHRPGEPFIKGPLPLTWFKVASTCGGRSVDVALLVWYAANWQRSNPAKLTPSILREFDVHPKTARAVLRKLAGVGLVSVEFHRGRSPLVTLLDPQANRPGA